MDIRITDKGGLKPTFTQWDVDRVLKVSGCTSQPSLRFDNPELSRSIVVVAEADGSNWSCKVPNFMLQFSGPMIVSVFIQPDEGKTIYTARYNVAWAKKPQDYEYTENIGYINWVQKSEEVQDLIDDIQEMLDNGDFKGDKGDAFTYADFTEEQLAALKGDKGDQGDQGPQGAQGAAFTYSDFTSEQLAALKGETGATGPQGIRGEKGEKGDAFQYTDFTAEQLEGLRGPQGIQGPRGPKGDQGFAGATGPQGPAGQNGTDGRDGTDGVGVPSGGATGDFLRKKSDTDYDTEWDSFPAERVIAQLDVLREDLDSDDFEWTLYRNYNSTGTLGVQNGFAITTKKPMSPGTVFVNKSPSKDENDKKLSAWLHEFDGTSWLRRTAISAGQSYKAAGTDANAYRLAFGYPTDQNVTITQEAIDDYFGVEIDSPIPTKTSQMINDSGFTTHALPLGGTTGQVLKKKSGTDYDTEWANESGGGGSADVFWATYGTTGSADIETAYQAGKIVLTVIDVDGEDVVLQLVNRTSSTYHGFTGFSGRDIYNTSCDTNVWDPVTTGVIPYAYTSNPEALGVAFAGSSGLFSRGDHVHQKPTASDIGAVASNQGSGNAGKFLVVGNDGVVVPVTMATWSAGSY